MIHGRTMKHNVSLRSPLLLAVLIWATAPATAQIAINNTAVAPNAKSILDLSDASRGLLLPRMTRAERIAIGAPANSLLVYQTDDFVPAAPALPEPKGLWYRDGLLWVRVGSGGPAWQLGGNAGTNPATNYIGTTDAQDFSIRTNGTERIRILGLAGPSQGFVGINQAAPQERLEVSGAMRVNGTTATANAGDIRLNPVTNAHDGYTDNGLPYPASGWYQLENVFGTRLREGYIAQGAVSCTYPIGPPTGPNSNVTLGAPNSDWPVIDDPAFVNISSFGTLETPYSRFWEDGRHQFLYLDDDFLALNICPNTDINGIAFQALSNSSGGFNYQHVRMKNTLSTAMVTFDLVGLQNCLANLTPATQNIVTGWNIHNFTSPFQWTGTGSNVLVEYSFDNQDWTGNVAVQSETTTYPSNYSFYCDACGHINGNPNQTCYWTTPPGCGPPPGGTYPPTTQTAAGAPNVLCVGWGHTGGPFLTTTSGTITCDGTFTYSAAQGAFFKRPLLALYASNTGNVNPVLPGNYLVAQQGVMIGTNAWSTSGAFPNQAFKGPGTISAQKAVYANGVMLSDHVFDQYFDGSVAPSDAAMGKQYAHLPVREMANYVEKERHLPTMDGRSQWENNGAFSLDHVTNQMWVTVEAQALYIKELNERTQALQKYLVEKRLQQLGKR